MLISDCFEKWSHAFSPFNLTEETRKEMCRFLEEVRRANQRVGLTGPLTEEQLFWGHLVDSLMILKALRHEGKTLRCLDVGAGGGFPGVPVALARPLWQVTLLESNRKKAEFLKTLPGIFPSLQLNILPGRAETLAHQKEHREAYDLAFCRAVGPFSTVLELTLPFLRVGGCLLAHRGEAGQQEAESSAQALKKLGGEADVPFEYKIPGKAKARFILCVKKMEPTPDQYPRRVGVPAKRPL